MQVVGSREAAWVLAGQVLRLIVVYLQGNTEIPPAVFTGERYLITQQTQPVSQCLIGRRRSDPETNGLTATLFG